ncbi:hypothetical protein E4U28_005621 [Claviceps purpurea]|nr:hypothetical protein E4U28_005621 [Claviceps purpurea]
MVVQDFAKRFRGYVPLVSATTASAGTAHSNGRWSRAFIVMSISNMVLFLMTASMMTSLGIRSQKRVLNAELRATSSYTPIYDMIDLEPSIRKINGTVMPAGKLSIARQFPNPAADAIWMQDIELIRPIPVTREQIIKMGKDPDTVAKLEDDVWGLGDDAYVAALDLFHNLHCLNVSIQAHCIDFEKLTEWHKEASIDLKKYLRVMKKPPGVKERPTEVWHPEEWFERQN